jgi:thioredoxin reductase (NADPH)
MERFDVAIIGTGPAGLEAALTLKNRDKKILLLGNNNSSDKVYKAHEIKNYLGLPNISGEDFSKAFINHINVMGIEITEDVISQVYDMGDYFALQGHGQEMYEAKSVIIATGVKFEKPYKGEQDFLGRGVSYCATCDAPLYRGKNIAVVLETLDEFDEVEFLASVANKLTLIPLFDGEIKKISNVEVVKDKPIEIKGERKANKLVLENNEVEFDGLFILKKSVPLSYLLQGIEMDGAHIAVNRQMETNIKGVFACGDITGKPYQYIKAAGEGNVAALSAVSYLANNK